MPKGSAKFLLNITLANGHTGYGYSISWKPRLDSGLLVMAWQGTQEKNTETLNVSEKSEDNKIRKLHNFESGLQKLPTNRKLVITVKITLHTLYKVKTA